MAKNFNDDEDYIDLDKQEDEDETEDEDRGDTLETDEDEDEEELDEDEEESEDEDEEEEEEEHPKGKIKIPKERFDEVNEQYKAAKQRERWLEEQLEKLINSGSQDKKKLEEITAEAYDFEEAEEKYISLVIEGDAPEAAKLRREINAKRAEADAQRIKAIKEEAAREIKAAQDEEKFNLLIENYESKYDFLDPGSKRYNAEAVDTINTLMAGYLAKGSVRSEALKKAVEKVVPMFKVAEKKTPTGAPDKRTLEQKKKNIQAIKRTPVQLKGKNAKDLDIDTLDVTSLDDKEFAKMSKDRRALAKLRGDIL